MPAIVSFSISLAGHSHSIRCEVERTHYGHSVAYCDLAHVRDLVDTHGLTSADLEAFEAKAIEAFELKARASKIERLADDKEVA